MRTATVKIDADEVLERLERRIRPAVTAACDLAETVNRVLDQANEDAPSRSSDRHGTMLLADEVAELRHALATFTERSGELVGDLEDETARVSSYAGVPLTMITPATGAPLEEVVRALRQRAGDPGLGWLNQVADRLVRGATDQ